MMTILAIANQKGGCAKTTTVVNLSAALAEIGQRVLLVDLDPQANASQWLTDQASEVGVFEVFTTKTPIKDLVSDTNTAGISLLAGTRDLAGIEKAMAGELSVETRLKRRLAGLDQAAYDYILIDTPPTLGLMTFNALSAAQQVLVPVTTHVMTLSGVAQLMETIDEVREILNPSLSLLGLLPCRVDQRTRHSRDILDALVERFADKVLSPAIRENVRLAEAPSFKQSILSYRPSSTASADFRALALEVLRLNSIKG